MNTRRRLKIRIEHNFIMRECAEYIRRLAQEDYDRRFAAAMREAAEELWTRYFEAING